MFDSFKLNQFCFCFCKLLHHGMLSFQRIRFVRFLVNRLPRLFFCCGIFCRFPLKKLHCCDVLTSSEGTVRHLFSFQTPHGPPNRLFFRVRNLRMRKNRYIYKSFAITGTKWFYFGTIAYGKEVIP